MAASAVSCSTPFMIVELAENLGKFLPTKELGRFGCVSKIFQEAQLSILATKTKLFLTKIIEILEGEGVRSRQAKRCLKAAKAHLAFLSTPPLQASANQILPPIRLEFLITHMVPKSRASYLEALNLALRVIHPLERSNLLHLIATLRLKDGFLKDSKETALMIPDAYLKSTALLNLVKYYFEHQSDAPAYLKAAVTLTPKIPDSRIRDKAYLSIVQMYLNIASDEFAAIRPNLVALRRKATSIAQKIEHRPTRGMALQLIRDM